MEWKSWGQLYSCWTPETQKIIMKQILLTWPSSHLIVIHPSFSPLIFGILLGKLRISGHAGRLGDVIFPACLSLPVSSAVKAVVGHGPDSSHRPQWLPHKPLRDEGPPESKGRSQGSLHGISRCLIVEDRLEDRWEDRIEDRIEDKCKLNVIPITSSRSVLSVDTYIHTTQYNRYRKLSINRINISQLAVDTSHNWLEFQIWHNKYWYSVYPTCQIRRRGFNLALRKSGLSQW